MLSSEAQHHASIGRPSGPSEDGDAVGKKGREEKLSLGLEGSALQAVQAWSRTEGSGCRRIKRIESEPGAPW